MTFLTSPDLGPVLAISVCYIGSLAAGERMNLDLAPFAADRYARPSVR